MVEWRRALPSRALDEEDPVHGFITHMRARPGKRDEVVALTTAMLEKTQSEEGVAVYVFATDAESPDDFWFYDLYESEAARKAHESSEEFARTMPALMRVAELVSVTKLEPYGPLKITPPAGD